MMSKFILLVIIFFGLYFDNLNIFKFCILSSLAHEAGHILAYLVVKRKIPHLNFSLYGIKMTNDVKDKRQLFFVLVSGPAINLFIAIFGFMRLNKYASINMYVVVLINLIIFIINMLPLYYLDGGQMLMILSGIYENNYKSISAIISVFLCVMLIGFTYKKWVNTGTIWLFFMYFLLNIVEKY